MTKGPELTMPNTVLSASGATPYLALLAAVAVHTRPLILLAGFLVAVRGTSGPKRSAMFADFAHHLASRHNSRR
ncbi:hypothetical protein [Streptomyces sp. b62]|uniref:hypothetical protein n=1 Tax=Streptomyces sp. b62 TaxID=1827627 RepID=UPI000BF223C7|nr:hypothetical protein [Streptomyces sp. b62]